MKSLSLNACRMHRGVLAAAVVAASFLPASSALAATLTALSDVQGCTPPTLSQPFLAAGDSNSYTLVPGEAVDTVSGAGWTLTGGASLRTATLADGATGQVLDIPSGAKAVSPSICVNSGYATARGEVRNVAGTAGIQFAVSYQGTKTWGNPLTTGTLVAPASGWGLSLSVNLLPNPNVTGWQIARFTFTGGGTKSDSQLYDFWVDPRMRS